MCYHMCGELLPRRFTLTSGFPLAVCFLLHFPSLGALALRAQALPGSVSNGARTFLGIVSLGYYFATIRPVALPESNRAVPHCDDAVMMSW
jgi:hypothetical protein